jgi:hypothetical protein
MESAMREDTERQEDIVDLGPATEVTQGIYDPVKKENLVTPQARDF